MISAVLSILADHEGIGGVKCSQVILPNVPGENGLVGADAIRETIRNPRATKAFEKGEGKS